MRFHEKNWKHKSPTKNSLKPEPERIEAYRNTVHCQYQSYNLFVLGTRHGNDCFANLSMNHMFYMALENSICDDYATEKFHRSLLYPVVPVVMGGANYKVEYWKLWNFK